MRAFKKLLLLSALLPLLSIGSAYGADVAARGGGGGMRGGEGREGRGFENHGDQYHRDGAYGNYGGYGGAAVYPIGYPAGGYGYPENPFPDDASEDAIYRANQHPGE